MEASSLTVCSYDSFTSWHLGSLVQLCCRCRNGNECNGQVGNAFREPSIFAISGCKRLHCVRLDKCPPGTPVHRSIPFVSLSNFRCPGLITELPDCWGARLAVNSAASAEHSCGLFHCIPYASLGRAPNDRRICNEWHAPESDTTYIRGRVS